MIIASLLLGVILGAVLTRPRRWDLHICGDDTADADDTARTTATGHGPGTVPKRSR
ncbi:hypothetical protein ACLQ2R_35405 [Streptosporangium sp. DT93]|uniref:hypothetical protein n=1 Tax=Streptosporangium sp. DT93 TaxID=3393428 RepID=UPI003CF07EFB